TVGPTNPPSPLKILISPSAAAATDSPRVRVGSTQKEGPKPIITPQETHSQNMSQPKRRSNTTVIGNINPDMISGRAVWRKRSPVRSEDHPHVSWATAPSAKGKPEITAVNDGVSPEAF